MARSKVTASAGSIVGEFVRILPDSIRKELDIYADSLPPLNLVGALNALDDKELQEALRSCEQTRIGPQLTRLGVDNNKGRPRVPDVLIAKLARGLSRGDMSAKLVLQMLTAGVYNLLLVRAAELTSEFPPGWYRKELDTPVLRALAVMGAHRLNDPSAPWALAGMVDAEDPAVKILVKPDAMEALELSTGQFLLQAKPEKHEVLREWVQQACYAADRPGQSGADSSAANDAEAVCRPAPDLTPPEHWGNNRHRSHAPLLLPPTPLLLLPGDCFPGHARYARTARRQTNTRQAKARNWTSTRRSACSVSSSRRPSAFCCHACAKLW